jgi:hypothetical protein
MSYDTTCRAGKPRPYLVPLDHFKALLGLDDREDETARFCLAAATDAIESYCRRKLLGRRIQETIVFGGERLLTLREYPVRELSAVWLTTTGGTVRGPNGGLISAGASALVEPDFYQITPECEGHGWAGLLDLPAFITLSQGLRLVPEVSAFKVMYKAGYCLRHVPADLASACMELGLWNYTRLRGKKAGTGGRCYTGRADPAPTGVSLPENVRVLLEPYRRKMI